REMLSTWHGVVRRTEWALGAAAATGAPRDKLALNRLGLSQGKVVAKPGPDERPTGRPITIGYLGRFEAIKGVHDLARATASLPRDVAVRVEFPGPLLRPAGRSVLGGLRGLAPEDCRITVADALPPAGAPPGLAGHDA